ncbi:uncharacterized protein LOC123011204 isoform X2 [Tribolium madens]|uniref:uncharacterized protein LOC123011204 isoform X2 n=1 Tax=Tribolium madens TaxID=41895 RepID=UPI001CF76647|nr:uncharacterized protein LOC123011204 isoform X2 [Tribolium madens]
MLRYALVYIAAFMFICGKYNAINIQPLPPFNRNFLGEVANFEPETGPQHENGVLEERESMDEEEDEENCPPNQKFPRCSNHEKKTNGTNFSKRELDEIGSLFVNHFLENDRELRNTEEEENKEHDENNDPVMFDSEFIEQQKQVKNITEQGQKVYEKVEQNLQENTMEECTKTCEEESDKSSNRHQTGPLSSLVKMHFYKHNPSKTGQKLRTQRSVAVSLYPKNKIPQQYDYIALLSNDDKFDNVPAVKVKVFSDRNSRGDNFFPFFVSTYKKEPHKVPDLGKLKCRHCTHVPILFINTIPDSLKRLSKRSSNYDISNNKYLRDADLLVENIKTSLKMEMDDDKTPKFVDGGVLVNSGVKQKKDVSGDLSIPFINQHQKQGLDNNFKAGFVQNLPIKDPVLMSNYENDRSFESPQEIDSIALKNENPSKVLLNNEKTLVQNQLNPLQWDLTNNRRHKSDKNALDMSPAEIDNLLKSAVGKLDLPPLDNKDLKSPLPVVSFQNDFNSNSTQVNARKEEDLIDSIESNDLVKSIVDPIATSVVKSVIDSVNSGQNKLDGWAKNVIRPLDARSRDKTINLVKKEILTDTSKVDNSFVDNELDLLSNEANSLVSNLNHRLLKHAINPSGNVKPTSNKLKSKEISSLSIDSNDDNLGNNDINTFDLNQNSFVKDEVSLGETGNSDKFEFGDTLMKNDIPSANFEESLGNRDVGSFDNSLDTSLDSSLDSSVDSDLNQQEKLVPEVKFSDSFKNQIGSDNSNSQNLINSNKQQNGIASKFEKKISNNDVNELLRNFDSLKNSDPKLKKLSMESSCSSEGDGMTPLAPPTTTTTPSPPPSPPTTPPPPPPTEPPPPPTTTCPSSNAPIFEDKGKEDYENEDLGNILDLLANNLTTSGQYATQTGATSIPTISANSSDLTPITGVLHTETSGSEASSVATTTAKGIIERGKSAFIDKLHDLQKDLKLVFEIQNRQTKQDKRHKRSKREASPYTYQRYRRKCHKNKVTETTTEMCSPKAKKLNEVVGLGKLLEWKNQHENSGDSCSRFKHFSFKKWRKRRKKKKKKKKKKKWWKRIFGKPTQHHFLGADYQNLL